MNPLKMETKDIPEYFLKEWILNLPFEKAHLLVMKHICSFTIEEVHQRVIKHQNTGKFTMDLAPRGFGKSTTGTVTRVITKILREPNTRILISSKTQTQAESFLKEIRTHLEENEKLLSVFGDLKGEKWTDKEFIISSRDSIKKEATVTALGASGAVVSKHFDEIIADDIVGFENARTKAQRDKLKEWFYSSLKPTLEPDGELHILGTRYNPQDLYQTFSGSGNYSVQIQKAIRQTDIGEVSLWGDKFSLKELKKIKAEAGSIIFGMQYQNDVDLAKGDIFKSTYFKHFNYYEERKGSIFVKVREDEGAKKVRVYFGVDLAISQKETADFFVLAVIGVDDENNVYVLDYKKARLTFDKQIKQIKLYATSKYPMVEKIGIESVAYQAAMSQELKRTTHLPIKEINTHTDKVTRAMKRSALFENGKVFFRNNMGDLEECLLLFPDGEHDDLFDGLDIAITTSGKGNSINVMSRANLFI